MEVSSRIFTTAKDPDPMNMIVPSWSWPFFWYTSFFISFGLVFRHLEKKYLELVKSKTRQHYTCTQVKLTSTDERIDGSILSKGRIIASDLEENDLMKWLFIYQGQTVKTKSFFNPSCSCELAIVANNFGIWNIENKYKILNEVVILLQKDQPCLHCELKEMSQI